MSTMTTEDKLTEAQNALHQLIMGRSVAKVTLPSGQEVSYTQTNIEDLRAYISELERELAIENGQAAPRRYRPIKFGF